MDRPACLAPARPHGRSLLPRELSFENARAASSGTRARKWLALSFLFCAAPLWAQYAPPEVLPEVVVTAARVGTTLLSAPAFMTVISAKEIENSPASTLPELLRSKAGLVVSSYGATGALSTVSIRGSTSSQVLVLLNGVPLNSALSSSVDLSQIPTGMVERIEVVRGGESPAYGSNAIGGVIDIITKGAAGKSSFSAAIENGSYIPHAAEVVSPSLATTPEAADPLALVDSQRLSVSASTSLGPLGVNAGGSYTRAANGFVWNDTAGIGTWRKESGAGGASGDGFLGVTAPLGPGRLTANGSAATSTYGVPGPLSAPTRGTQTTTSAQGTLGYTVGAPTASRFGVTSKLFYQYRRVHYTDPFSDSTSTTDAAGGEFTMTYRISGAASILGGARARFDGVDSSDVGRRSRFNLAGIVAAPISPTGRLTLTPTLRYDYFTDAPSGFSYRLGAVFALTDRSVLKGSIGESYRVPSIYDLYLPAGPYAAGNPGLRPEIAYAGDFGYSLQGRTMSLDAALFARLVENQIVWASALGGTYAPENLGRSLLPGAQIEGKVRLLEGLSLSLSDSFIYSFLLADASASYSLADNKRVPYVPANTLTGGLSYSYRGTSLSLEGQYVTAVQTELGKTVAPHVALNFSYRQKLGRGFSFSLVAKNLLDSVYETAAGYPMPPLSLWTGIAISR